MTIRTRPLPVWTTLLCALAFMAVAHAQTIFLTFDELPPNTPLPVTVKGITISDTSGATYDTANGGQLTYVQDPTLEGLTAGETITITLPFAVNVVRFGLALSNTGPIPTPPTGANVALFAAGGISLGTFPLIITLADPFWEGQFLSPTGVDAISKIVITFPPAIVAAAAQFGLDNLIVSTYDNIFTPDAFAVDYAANLNIGDSVVNITNSGAAVTVPAGTTGSRAAISASTPTCSMRPKKCWLAAPAW